MYGHVITKFSRMGSLPHFLTHGAPLRGLRARELRYENLATSPKLLDTELTNITRRHFCSLPVFCIELSFIYFLLSGLFPLIVCFDIL